MSYDLTFNKEYKTWLTEIKFKIRNVQIKAALKVNTELLVFYWELGEDIVTKQATAKWGDGFLLQLSKDLISEFPEMKGFSERNLKYIRQWYLFYSSREIEVVTPIRQQPVAQITKTTVSLLSAEDFRQKNIAQIIQIPWGHNIAIITKCKNIEEALYYVQNTLVHNWSRSVLLHQIESGLYQREGKSVNTLIFLTF